MPTYILTVIYKIICNDLNITDCYVGHTTNLKSRTAEHKYNCNNGASKSYNTKVYDVIRANGGWINWSIITVEKYPCLSKRAAEIREHYWYFELKSTLNSISPVLDIVKQTNTLNNMRLKKHDEAVLKHTKRKEDKEQFLIDNEEQIKQKAFDTRKAYELQNRERINTYMREYNSIHKAELAARNKKYKEARVAKKTSELNITVL